VLLRISTPGKQTTFVDLGPCPTVERLPSKLARLPIDEAIAETWRRGHPIRLSRPR
jgi:hypothetical protein